VYLYGRKPNGGTFGVPLPSMRANAEDIMLTPRAGLLPIHEDDRFSRPRCITTLPLMLSVSKAVPSESGTALSGGLG
jgi:hypothetical protein